VQRTTDFYHGKYACKLNITQHGKDTLYSYIYCGTGNRKLGIAGLAYNQQPTGIRFYYKSEIDKGDTAVVSIAFKKGGSYIAAYGQIFTGKVSTYTLYTQTFSPALSVSPDTVIIYIAPYTTNKATGRPQGTPGNSFTIDSLSFTGVTAQPAGFNGDFENWHGDTMYSLPGWYQLNQTRSTDAKSGKYALQITTSYFNNTPLTGAISPGYNDTTLKINGFPFLNQIDTLSFYYKYAPDTINDSALIYLFFKKGGASISQYKFLGPANTYTHVDIPFNLGASPDTVIVYALSSAAWNPRVSCIGSTLLIDELHFKSQPFTSIASITQTSDGMVIFPNPAQNVLYFNAQRFPGNIEAISIMDMSGRTMVTKSITNVSHNKSQMFDISALAEGLYVLAINTDKGTIYQKFVKAH
jgi:hypothetical protein